jgi:polar amino acid transport system substrate-binding protein
MRSLIPVAMLALAACAAAPSAPLGEVAPTGALRVAIGVGPSASAFWAVRDASGNPHGVTVDLGKAAAAKLGVPVKLIEYPNSGEITAAASKDAWDLSFMPQDPEREKFVDTGPAYVVYETAFIVRAGSDIRRNVDVDRAGVKVGAIDGTSTSRKLKATLEHASLTLFPKAEDAIAQFAAQHLDALAMGREAVIDVGKKNPGTRVLDDNIASTGVVVVVPKNRPAARAWAARFIEEAKADGTVRRALDGAGFAGATVPPSSTVR